MLLESFRLAGVADIPLGQNRKINKRVPADRQLT